MGTACSAKCRSNDNNQDNEPIINIRPDPSIKNNKIQIQQDTGECYPSSNFKISEDVLSSQGLVCTICLQIVRQAVVDKCGHVYGKRCIQKWLKKQQSCPLSRQQINYSDLKQELNIRKKVEGCMKNEIRAERKQKYLKFIEEQNKIKEKKKSIHSRKTSIQPSRQSTIEINLHNNNNTHIIQIQPNINNINNNLVQAQ